MASKRNAGTLYISIQLATEELARGAQQVQKQLSGIATSAGAAGRAMSVAFSLPLTLLGGAAVNAFGSFDKAMAETMSIMEGVGDTTRSEMEAVAKSVSEKLPFSATEAAKAFYFLGSAGLDAAQSMKALPTVAEFATAGQMDLAKATEYLVDTQSSFNLKSKDAQQNMINMTRVSDVLTKANLMSNATVEQMAQALSGKLGGAARQAGLSIENAAAAVGAFASQGVKGASGGTALAIVIRDLQTKSLKFSKTWKDAGIAVFDAAGSMRPLSAVMKDFEAKMVHMAPAQKQMFLLQLGLQQKSMGFTQALIGLSGTLEEYERNLQSAGGTTHEVAMKQIQNFQDQLKLVKNQLTNVGIEIGAKLAPYVLKFANDILSLAKAFTSLSDSTQTTLLKIAAMVAFVGPLAYGFKAAISAVSALVGVFGSLSTIVGTVTAAIGTGGISGALGALVGLIPQIAVVLAVGTTAWFLWGDNVKGILSDIGDKTVELVSTFQKNFPTLSAVAVAASEQIKGIFVQNDAAIAESADQVTIRMGKSHSVFKDIVVGVAATIAEKYEEALKKISKSWEDALERDNKRIDAFSTVYDNFMVHLGELTVGGIENIEKSFEGFFTWVWTKQPGWKKWCQDLRDTFVGAMDEAAANGKAKLAGGVGGVMKQLVTPFDEKNSFQAKGAEINDREVEAAWDREQQRIQERINGEMALLKINEEILRIDEAGSKSNDPSADARIKAQKLSDQADALAKTKAWYDSPEGKAAGKAAENEAKRRAKALAQLQEDAMKSGGKNSADAIRDSMEEALNFGDMSTFDALKENLYSSVYDTTLAGLQDSIKEAGGGSAAIAAAEEQARNKANAAVDVMEDKQYKSMEKNAKKMRELHEAAYQDSVQAFEGYFRTAIDGGAKGLGDALKKVFEDILVSFGSNLAATIAQSMGFEGSLDPKNIGASFARQFLPQMSSLFGGSAGMSGIGPVADGAQYAGMLGGTEAAPVAATASMATIAPVVGAAVGAYLTYKGGSNLLKGEGEGIGFNIDTAARGALAMVTFGGSELVRAMGVFGKGMSEAEAQLHAFGGGIEEVVKKLKVISLYDKNGKLQTSDASKYNFIDNKGQLPADFKEQMASWSDEQKKVFAGLAAGMKSTLGITESVTGEMAFLLHENLFGNLDNARLLVMQLGLSLEDMTAGLESMGMSGEMSWRQVTQGISGLQEAFKPGLVAIGDVAGAYEALVDSGGRGMAAIKSIKDMAIETAEKGGTELKDLENQLSLQGVDPTEVKNIMAAIAASGVTTLQGLAEASNLTAGSIVSNIEVGSKALADKWAEMTTQIDNLQTKLANLPKEIETNMTLNIQTNLDENTQKLLDGKTTIDTTGVDDVSKHARGAVVKGPTFFNGGKDVMGEAGDEAILPLTNVRGSLGVRAQIASNGATKGKNKNLAPVINVDARGSNLSEADIKRAIKSALPMITSHSVAATGEKARRSKSYARNFGV